MRETRTVKVLNEILREFSVKIAALSEAYRAVPKEYRHEVSGERAVWIQAAKIVNERRFNELNKGVK